jgi:hypothetical protein
MSVRPANTREHPDIRKVVRKFAAILAIATAANACHSDDLTVSWRKPTTNNDGSPLRDLAGYYVYYGDNPKALTHVIQVPDPAASNYVIHKLKPGTYYFRVAAYNASGLPSDVSATVSTVISR